VDWNIQSLQDTFDALLQVVILSDVSNLEKKENLPQGSSKVAAREDSLAIANTNTTIHRGRSDDFGHE